MDKRKIASGIFVLVSIIVLVLIYIFFTEFKISRNRFYYEVTVADASWLERGDIVTVMGINMGRVEKLWIEGDRVVIRFFIDGLKLREGAKIIVENQGFLGRKRLIIKQGSGAELPPGTRLEGTTGWDLGNLIAAGENLVDSLNVLLKGVKELVVTYNNTGKEMLKELKSLSSDLSQFLNTWEKTGGNLNKLAEDLKEISVLIKRADSILQGFEKSEGTLKKFMYDDSTYRKIDSLLTEIKTLIKDIKQNPRKYFKFSIF